MAVAAAQVTVGTAATQIVAAAAVASGYVDRRSCVVKNITGTAAIFLGPAGVTTATGLRWDTTDDPISMDLESGEELWGIVAATPQAVHVLASGT